MTQSTLTELEDIIDEPVPIKTIKLKRTWWQRVTRKPAKTIQLTLSRSTTRTAYKITKLVKSLQTTAEDNLLDLIHDNAHTMALVIATAVHNRNDIPLPDYLVDAILDNFNNEELKEASERVYRGLDVENFFGSMALLKGLQIVKDIPETTASQPSSGMSS